MPNEPEAYVLVSPSHIVRKNTVRLTYDEACQAAFDELYNEGKVWVRKYYKDWDGFIKERVRRRWWIYPAYLEIADDPARNEHAQK
jgi:hypothetical protein